MNISISRFLPMRAYQINGVLLTCFLTLGAYTAAGQSWDTDFAHLQKKISPPQERKKSGWLSAQVQAPEFFDNTNREFGTAAIREWGLLKGGFLFVDRLTRANRLYATQVYPARVNAANRIRDHARDYTLRTQ